MKSSAGQSGSCHDPSGNLKWIVIVVDSVTLYPKENKNRLETEERRGRAEQMMNDFL